MGSGSTLYSFEGQVAAMLDLVKSFLGFGGFWLALIAAIVGVAYKVGKNAEGTSRPEEAVLRQRWLAPALVGLAMGAWVEHYLRLTLGWSFLRGSGPRPWLPAVLIVPVVGLATLAWLGFLHWQRARPWPWLSLLVVVGLVLAATNLLSPGPKSALKVGDPGGGEVRYLQQRLAYLACFEPGESIEGLTAFEGQTLRAVVAFQQANDLLDHRADLGSIGVVRHRREFPLLTRPFYFLHGPKPCTNEGI